MEALVLLFEPGDFLFRHLGQLGLRRLAFQQGAVFRQVGHRLKVSLPDRHQFFQAGVFLPQLLRALRVVERLGVTQGGFDLRKAAAEPLDLGTKVHGEMQIRPQRDKPCGRTKG